MLLLSKQRTFSLISNLHGPNDALQAAGLEGRWHRVKGPSGWDELLSTLMTSLHPSCLKYFESTKICCGLIAEGLLFTMTH